LEEFKQHPHTMYGIIEKWAKETPDKVALIIANTGKKYTYEELRNEIIILSYKLYNMGFRKGDIITTSLLFLDTHIILAFACAKLGVIWCPFDVRLKPPEIMRNLGQLKEKTKMYCHLGKTIYANFGMIGSAVQKNNPWLDYVVQFSDPDDRYRKGITPAYKIFQEAKKEYEEAKNTPEQLRNFEEECEKVGENNPAIIIFTTGSTGYPKAALLPNAGLACHSMCLSKALEANASDRMLVNLPPSHVGGTTEQLLTPLFGGATAIVLHLYDPQLSLEAIQKYKATLIGQIPAMYKMEWNLPDYDQYDLSSLKCAIYAGQQGDRPLAEGMREMAGKIATGYGTTENCGFITYSKVDAPIDEILSSIGFDLPISPVTIRKPMNSDGTAGEELPDGEIGEICIGGPQVFLGYFGDEETTKKTISKDGILYTGDMGFKDELGVHLSGRRKFLIKPKGYQVFPPEVEAHISELPEVEYIGIVGANHKIFTEGIVAYIKVREGMTLSKEKIMEHCKEIAAYKRPSLIVFLDEFPLNRVAKTDYLVLRERVEEDIEQARQNGGWDTV